MAGKNPERSRANKKRWRKNNPEKVSKHKKTWYQKNRESILDKNKTYQKEHISEITAQRKRREQDDPAYKMRVRASIMVNKMLKSQGSSKRGQSCIDYFPWTPEQLIEHITGCMKQPGNEWMTWENQGPYNPETHHLPGMRTWQLDHVVPHSDLPYDSMAHPNFKKAWALSNLRPLDAKQNVMDGVRRTRHSKKNKPDQ